MALFISNSCGNSLKNFEPVKNLYTLAPGEEGFVFLINLDVKTIKELELVGVKRNTLIESICCNDSTMIVGVKDRRVAVDRDTASNILVHKV
jgi:hypothetical protein